MSWKDQSARVKRIYFMYG